MEDWRWKGQVSALKDQGGRVHGKSTHLILRRLEFYAEQGTNLLNECSQRVILTAAVVPTSLHLLSHCNEPGTVLTAFHAVAGDYRGKW